MLEKSLQIDLVAGSIFNFGDQAWSTLLEKVLARHKFQLLIYHYSCSVAGLCSNETIVNDCLEDGLFCAYPVP